METFVIVLQIITCILMIALVLLQPSKGGSFFTSSNQGVFGSSGGTTFLFRATMWCAAFLAVSCIFLSWVKVSETSQSVVSDTPVTTPVAPEAIPPAPLEQNSSTPAQ
ncbi:MAG: preprotein translocase subunit SecG [Bdellovibrionota bacterium]